MSLFFGLPTQVTHLVTKYREIEELYGELDNLIEALISFPLFLDWQNGII